MISGVTRGALLALALGLALPGCAGNRPQPRGDAAPAAEWQLVWADGTSARPEAGPRPEQGLADHPGSLDQPRPPDQRPADRPPAKPDQPCPGGCDDGNPCSLDACGPGGCTHQPAGQIVHRFYNPSTGAHAYAPLAQQPAGFKVEGPYFRTLATATAGAVPIYQQVSSSGDYMLSLSASEGVACCGYSNWGSIGHGFGAPHSGTIPLYRLYHPDGLHLSSTSASEALDLGYQLEGITAHVCSL